MSLSLASDGIEVTLISDAAVFAIMSRVNKVIVGTHAVLADGGLKALSGSHPVALAAQHYSVPVLLLLILLLHATATTTTTTTSQWKFEGSERHRYKKTFKKYFKKRKNVTKMENVCKR